MQEKLFGGAFYGECSQCSNGTKKCLIASLTLSVPLSKPLPQLYDLPLKPKYIQISPLSLIFKQQSFQIAVLENIMLNKYSSDPPFFKVREVNFNQLPLRWEFEKLKKELEVQCRGIHFLFNFSRSIIFTFRNHFTPCKILLYI